MRLSFEDLEERVLCCSEMPEPPPDEPPGEVSRPKVTVVPCPVIGIPMPCDLVIVEVRVRGLDEQQACYDVDIILDNADNHQVQLCTDGGEYKRVEIVPHGDGVHVAVAHLRYYSVVNDFWFVCDDAGGYGLCPTLGIPLPW